MVKAFMEEEERQITYAYYLTAWQTSHLMNSTGNYRQRITPEKLLGKDFTKKNQESRKLSPEEKAQELAKLKEKMGL